MKSLSRILPLVAVLLFSLHAMGQLRVPGTHVTFDFPDGGWNYLQTINPSRNVTIYIYAYEGAVLLDDAGDTVTPFMRIYVQRGYKESIYDLAYERYTQQPFQSLSESMDGLPSDGIAYVGAYTSASDKKDYQFRMVYFKENTNAIEIRLETSRNTFDQLDDAFARILKTVKIEK